MTRDNIIRLTRQVGGSAFDHTVVFTYEEVRRFMDLVAAAEREACAKECDAVAESANKAAVAGQYLIIRNGAEARRCIAAIRARGMQDPKVTHLNEWARDRLARHGIQIPEDDDANPSF